MNERLDPERRVALWLTDEAEARAPERLIHATRERVATTRQIGRVRAIRLGLRPATVSTRTRIVAACILALVVTTLALGLLLDQGSGPSVGSGFAQSTPRPSLTSLAPYACSPRSGSCLGPLPAGAFETHSFLPTVGYVVPIGWSNTLDTRGEVDLSYLAGGMYRYPDGTIFHDGISMFRRPVAESPVSATPVGGVGKTAGDLAQWLNGHVDLDASGLTPVSVGGTTGYRLTISVPAGPRTSPDHCTTDHGEPRCESLFISDDPAASFGFGIVGPESAVVYLLDTPSGDTVMVVIDDVDGVDRDGLIAAATPVVESLVFAR
ncbi:MAG TPA: hypothetical protein VID95_02525 [Candidatus Limnocylindrales bacterium]